MQGKWELNHNHLAQNLIIFCQAFIALLFLSFPTKQACNVQYIC